MINIRTRLLLSFLIIISCNKNNHKHNSENITNIKIESKGPEHGTLLIIGGAAKNIFYTKFMELIGGADAPIVVIPTAITSDTLTKEFLNNYKQSYIDKGFTNVTVLHTRKKEEANSAAFISAINNAKGVWFSGGRQWRHADSYLKTKTHKAFNDLLNRGGVIAGSSAGASIQGSFLVRGDTKKNTIMLGDHQEGLSFISNVAIDQHLLARNRQFDIYEILDKHPELLGIGLDENTGIIVKGDSFEVYGESFVAIYDGTRWSAERDTIYKLPQRSREFYFLKQGDQYDLKNRKVIQSKK
jgi:cyanophycinase